jgi:hypothetical protein
VYLSSSNNNNSNPAAGEELIPSSSSPYLEEEPEVVVKYRAFHTSARKYNQQDVVTYDTIDLYELHVKCFPLNKEQYDWQRMHPNEKPAMMVGGERRIILVTDPKYYSESGADHVVLPTTLIKRRYNRVAEDELSTFIEEGKNDEDIDVMLEQSIPGIAPVREILFATAEEHLLHPAVQSANPELDGKNEHERHNYTITFEPVECSSYMDCTVCIEIIKYGEPQLFLVGASIHDPRVKEARAKYKERRARVKKLKKMHTFLKAMMVMDSTWALLDSLDAMDDDSEIIRTKARAEVLGKEED